MKKYNNSFIKLFQKFCSMTEYGPEEVEPLDTADPEVYKKTPRCYPGIQMVPWISATCSKKWNSPYTPKKVTKDKLNQISQERTCRYLSLHRTEWMAPAIQDQLLVPQAKQKAAAPSICFEGRSPQSPHDCEQVSKPPEYVPSGDYSDFIDVNGNAD